MNLRALILAVLRNINEREDDATISAYRSEILGYINEGYLQAAISRIKPVKCAICQSVGGKIPLTDIGSDFYQINKILDKNSIEVRYSINSEYLFLKDGSYQVEYVFVPPELSTDMDEPIFTKAYHYILSDYAAYRMFLKGSKARQARGDAFLSSYLNGVGKLVEYKRTHIKNKFGCGSHG